MFRFVSSFRQDDDGVAAVEFALVGIPFIFLLMGLVEMSLMFLADNILQSATATAARQVKVGEIVGSGSTVEDEFRTAVCNELSAIIKCDSDNINVMIAGIDDTSDLGDAFSNNTLYNNNDFDTGGAQDYALVRIEYEYDILTPIMRPIFGTTNNSKQRTLIATTVMQNEPF